MIFKGQKFRRNNNLVFLDQCECGRTHNLGFGRICSPSAKGAVKSPFHDKNTKEDIYAKPIKCIGHSLTNSMCDEDRRQYLAYDARVYTCKLPPRKPE